MPLWLIISLLVVLAFGLGIWRGAPYLPILSRDTTPLFDLAGLRAGQTLIDLGSGDGRLLRAAARRGIRGIGYEINPLLVVISWFVCWRHHRLVTVHLANFWQVRLPPADAVYTFLLPKYMAELDRYLQAQVTQPTQLISFAFPIPHRHPDRQNTNTFIYHYRPRSKT